MSNSKPSKTPITSTSKYPAQRLPAPTLFVGPPSRNASSTSLRPPDPGSSPTATGRAPLARQHSPLADRSTRDTQPSNISSNLTSNLSSDLASAPTAAPSSLLPHSSPHRQSNAPNLQLPSQAEAEKQWASMQNTLEEVELNALSGTHVFGSSHSAALESLRAAQIDLARAWARSEADTAATQEQGNGTGAGFGGELSAATEVLASDRRAATGGGSGTRARSGTGSSGHSVGSLRSVGSAGVDSGGVEGSAPGVTGKTRLEEETENDVSLARKRREANDRYFARVNEGVNEVVRKLEDVARAMKAVEGESKEIWGDGESLGSVSVT